MLGRFNTQIRNLGSFESARGHPDIRRLRHGRGGAPGRAPRARARRTSSCASRRTRPAATRARRGGAASLSPRAPARSPRPAARLCSRRWWRLRAMRPAPRRRPGLRHEVPPRRGRRRGRERRRARAGLSRGGARATRLQAFSLPPDGGVCGGGRRPLLLDRPRARLLFLFLLLLLLALARSRARHVALASRRIPRRRGRRLPSVRLLGAVWQRDGEALGQGREGDEPRNLRRVRVPRRSRTTARARRPKDGQLAYKRDGGGPSEAPAVRARTPPPVRSARGTGPCPSGPHVVPRPISPSCPGTATTGRILTCSDKLAVWSCVGPGRPCFPGMSRSRDSPRWAAFNAAILKRALCCRMRPFDIETTRRNDRNGAAMMTRTKLPHRRVCARNSAAASFSLRTRRCCAADAAGGGLRPRRPRGDVRRCRAHVVVHGVRATRRRRRWTAHGKSWGGAGGGGGARGRRGALLEVITRLALSRPERDGVEEGPTEGEDGPPGYRAMKAFAAAGSGTGRRSTAMATKGSGRSRRQTGLGRGRRKNRRRVCRQRRGDVIRLLSDYK